MYDPGGFADFDCLDRILRRREEAGLLELASGPERAAAKRARQEEKARLKRQLAPERERKAKLRRAERRRQRRLGEPEEDVAKERTTGRLRLGRGLRGVPGQDCGQPPLWLCAALLVVTCDACKV